MSTRDTLLTRLAERAECSYLPGSPIATEPTALAALALLTCKEETSADRALRWLVRVQSRDGNLGVTATDPQPCWPTSLAILAWAKAGARYWGRIERAHSWLLDAKGMALHPRKGQENEVMGHNMALVGWPWVAGTHSWIEPTALAVIALKATGHGDHPRTREAVRLLIDRLLPTGGCNYGNTVVFGQQLLEHLQPTGLTMLALAGEKSTDERITRSLDYLEQNLSGSVGTPSLCFGLQGLAAHGRAPVNRRKWLAESMENALRRDRAPWHDALLLLAEQGESSPLVRAAHGTLIHEEVAL